MSARNSSKMFLLLVPSEVGTFLLDIAPTTRLQYRFIKERKENPSQYALQKGVQFERFPKLYTHSAFQMDWQMPHGEAPFFGHHKNLPNHFYPESTRT